MDESSINRFTGSIARDKLLDWQTYSHAPRPQSLLQDTFMVHRARCKFLKPSAGAAGLSMISSSAFNKLRRAVMPLHCFDDWSLSRSLFVLGSPVRRFLPLSLFSCALDKLDLGMDQQACN
jgi:hypothetical protein